MRGRSLRSRLVTWYALWLALVLAIAGALLYAGLREYLEQNLAGLQRQRAKRIAVFLETGPLSAKVLLEEMRARFAPEASGRFIRISTEQGQVLYQSGSPDDKSFDAAEVSRGRVAVETRKEKLPNGAELFIASLPVKRDGVGFLIETGESLAPALVELHRLLISLGITFVIVAGVALTGGGLLITRALHPVEEITRKAELITSRNLSERLPIAQTGDEFEHLSQALNRMITRLDEAFQHNRRFLADASHELRTPLTILRGELESFAQEQRIPADLRERFGSTLEEVLRLTNIVEGLFAMARLDAGEGQGIWTQFDLGQLAASTAEQMVLLAEDKGITLEARRNAPVFVKADRARLKQVLVNLLDNAIKYTGPKGRVDISVFSENGLAICEVADNGIGIPSDALPHLFERFFRVDKARSRDLGGAGLGLAIVKAICIAHGGSVQARSIPGRGSTFRVELPLSENRGTEKNAKVTG
jgi:heavy metal sensor kinase